jgi:hypothetical protein
MMADAGRDLAPPPDTRRPDVAPDLPTDPAPPPDLRPDLAPDMASGPDLTRGLVGYWKFDEGTGTAVADSSPTNNGGTLSGSAAWTGGAPFAGSGMAVAFDGTNDLMTVRQNLAPVLGDTSSLAFWIRTNQTGDDVPHQAPGVTGVEQAGGADDVFWGFINASGGIGVAAGNADGVTSNPINDNNWHHVALTRDAGNGRVQVYVDGQFVRMGTTVTGTKGTGFDTFGRITNAGRLRASLDDLRVYNRVLPATEVAALARP